MATQDKIIAGAMLIHGSFGTLWTLWAACQTGFPPMFVAANLALAAVGVAAGIGWFMQRRWSIYLGIAFFLTQLVHIFTPTFQWSFTLGFNLTISLGWINTGEFGLNLFALAMLLWVRARAFAPNNSAGDFPITPDT